LEEWDGEKWRGLGIREMERGISADRVWIKISGNGWKNGKERSGEGEKCG